MNLLKFAHNNFAKWGGRLRKKAKILKNLKFPNSKGAVLIEFAFGVSVLTTLIFYMQDLYRAKYLKERMKFVGTEIVNILQNISQNRSDKTITKADIRYAKAAAFLSWCPGRTLFPSQSNAFFMGCAPICILYYFYGTEKNTASCKWYCRTDIVNSGFSPSNILIPGYTGIWHERSVNFTQSDTSKIYPSFTIEKGEYKVIVETFVYYAHDRRKSDGSPNMSPKNSLGFYLITPRYYCNNNVIHSNGYSNNLNKRGSGDNINSGGFFNMVTIFTPKPGLFNETPPQ